MAKARASVLSWALILAVIIVGVPAAGAQSVGQSLGAVAQCNKQCDPIAANHPGPKRTGEPVRLFLYAHLDELFGWQQLGTDSPAAVKAPERVLAGLAWELDTNTNTPADLRFGLQPLILRFDSVGIEYRPDGKLRFTGQEAPLEPVKLTSDLLTFYVTLRALDPPAAPRISVHAVLRTGLSPTRGEVLAASDTADTSAVHNLVSAPNDPYSAWEYEVKLRAKTKVLPGADPGPGVTLFVWITQHNDDAARATLGRWGLHVGPKFSPRLVLSTDDPIRDHSGGLAFDDGKVVVRWNLSAAWGPHDVNRTSLRLVSTGRTPFPAHLISEPNMRGGISHGEYDQVRARWWLDVSSQRLPDGDYELTGSVENIQGTFVAERSFAFAVRGGNVNLAGAEPNAAASGLAPVAALVGLLFSALLGAARNQRTR